MKSTFIELKIKSYSYSKSRFNFVLLNRLNGIKNLFAFLALLVLSNLVNAQEKQQDSTKIETLDEVLVKAVRVEATSPITHSNVTKDQLQKRNLGQDIPVLLNYLPSVVTTTDAVPVLVTQEFVFVESMRSLLILQLTGYPTTMQNH